ncbi:unnamed protein product [Peniophora sp. CBMAI 1063]|nr:unnamed protein product [Peniophora sp. CBMAI 1063]
MLSQDYSNLFSSGLRTLARRVRRASQSHFTPPTPSTPGQLTGLVTPITPAPGISYINFNEPETPVLAPAPPPPTLNPAPPAGGIRKALRRMSTQTFGAAVKESLKEKHATMPAPPMPQIVRSDQMFAGFKSREDLQLEKKASEPALKPKTRVEKRVSFYDPFARDDASSDTSSSGGSAVTRAPPLAPRRKPIHLTIRTSYAAPRPLPATPPLPTAPPVPAKSAMKHYSQPHPVTRVQARKPVQRMTMSEGRPAQRTSQHRIQRPELQQRAQAYQAAYAAPPSPNNFLLFSATSVEFPTRAPPATIVSPYARPSRVPSHIKGPSHSSFTLPGYEKTPMSLHPYAAVSRALPDTPGSATSGDWRGWHEERGGWLIHA